MSQQEETIQGKRYWPWLAAPLSGVLLALCYPGWNLSGLVWVWMLPLLPAVWKRGNKRGGFAIAYLAGLVFWLLNLKWLWTVSGLGAMALAAFLALYFGFWGMLAASLGNPWRKRPVKDEAEAATGSGIQQAIARKQKGGEASGWLSGALAGSLSSLKFATVNAAAWVGFEWLRGWLFTGFGWNGLGVAFHQTPVLAQAADLVGVTGLAFLPVFFSAVLVQTGARLMAEARSGRLKPRMDFGVAAVLLALQFCYGVWRLKDIQGWETERVRILVVQQNILQDIKWDPREGAKIIQGYADATEEGLEQLAEEAQRQMLEQPEFELKSPDLVIWPESAMPDPLLFAEGLDGYLIYGGVRHMLLEEIRPLGHFTLVAGMNEMESSWDGQRATPTPGGAMYNSVAVVPPDGSLEEGIKTYRKLHLVIFGEYIPFVDRLPFLKKLFEFSAGASFAGNFRAGESTDPLKVELPGRDIDLIPSVCFEDTVGRLTRKFVRSEPQMIVNVTNDGWFKRSEAAAQHLANSRFRSIELRRPMVRSANTGVSAIISTTGSLQDPVTGMRQVVEDGDGDHFVCGHLYGHAYLPVHGPMSWYALAGDWFAYLCGAGVLMVWLRALLRRI